MRSTSAYIRSVSPDSFVGREREQALLDRLLSRAEAGQRQWAALVGEAGIGKTRTACELEARATDAGWQVFWGPCHRLDGTPAYRAWAGVLDAYARSVDREVLADEVKGVAPDLVRIAPSLSAHLPVPHSDESECAPEPHVLFDSVARVLRRAAERAPVLLVFDDVQWADPSSLLLLRFIASELRRSRVLLLCTYRPTEMLATSPAAALDGEIAKSGSVVRLQGLAPKEVGHLIADVTGEPPGPALVTRVYDATGGNPFFVREFVRLLTTGEGSDPAEVGETIRRRLEPLGEELLKILSCASVFGRDVDMRMLCELTGLSRARIIGMVEQAARTGLVLAQVPRPGSFRFAHALVSETLYASLDEIERADLHQAVARITEMIYRDHLGPQLATLAHHYLRAAPVHGGQPAVTAAVRAAQYALSRGAYEAAGANLEQAEQGLALLGPTPPQSPSPRTPRASFRREGDIWSVAFQGKVVRLKNVKGAAYIAELLRHPGREVHVLELIQVTEGRQLAAGAADRGLEMIDARATGEYRARLAELRGELEHAEADSDLGRKARLRGEIDFIEAELARSLGLGGRRRTTGSLAERSRVNVTRAIRTALRKLSSANKGLGRHLEAHLHTGQFCSYSPDPDHPVDWQH